MIKSIVYMSNVDQNMYKNNSNSKFQTLLNEELLAYLPNVHGKFKIVSGQGLGHQHQQQLGVDGDILTVALKSISFPRPAGPVAQTQAQHQLQSSPAAAGQCQLQDQGVGDNKNRGLVLGLRSSITSENILCNSSFDKIISVFMLKKDSWWGINDGSQGGGGGGICSVEIINPIFYKSSYQLLCNPSFELLEVSTNVTLRQIDTACHVARAVAASPSTSTSTTTTPPLITSNRKISNTHDNIIPTVIEVIVKMDKSAAYFNNRLLPPFNLILTSNDPMSKRIYKDNSSTNFCVQLNQIQDFYRPATATASGVGSGQQQWSVVLKSIQMSSKLFNIYKSNEYYFTYINFKTSAPQPAQPSAQPPVSSPPAPVSSPPPGPVSPGPGPVSSPGPAPVSSPGPAPVSPVSPAPTPTPAPANGSGTGGGGAPGVNRELDSVQGLGDGGLGAGQQQQSQSRSRSQSRRRHQQQQQKGASSFHARPKSIMQEIKLGYYPTREALLAQINEQFESVGLDWIRLEPFMKTKVKLVIDSRARDRLDDDDKQEQAQEQGQSTSTSTSRTITKHFLKLSPKLAEMLGFSVIQKQKQQFGGAGGSGTAGRSSIVTKWLRERELKLNLNDKSRVNGKYELNLNHGRAKTLLVNTNIGGKVCVGRRMVKLLRLLTLKGNEHSTEDVMSFEFHQNLYTDVDINWFNSIRIFITDLEGNHIYTEQNHPTICHLMFINL